MPVNAPAANHLLLILRETEKEKPLQEYCWLKLLGQEQAWVPPLLSVQLVPLPLDFKISVMSVSYFLLMVPFLSLSHYDVC